MTVFLLVFCFVLDTQGQKSGEIQKRKGRYGFQLNRQPDVSFNHFVDYDHSTLKPELHISVSVLNDALQFVKTEEGYSARYQVFVAVLKEENSVVQESWEEQIMLQNFEDTNARNRRQISVYRIASEMNQNGRHLGAGSYEVFVEVRDLQARKAFELNNNKRSFVISDVEQTFSASNDSLYISAIAFLNSDSFKTDEALPLTPWRRLVMFNHTHFAYLHLLEPVESESLSVNLRIYKQSDAERTLFYQNFYDWKPVPDDRRLMFTLPKDSLPEGRYQLRINGNSSGQTFGAEKDFEVVWFQKPTYLYKVDLAARPMKYLLSEQEFERVKGMGLDELTQWFNDYWQKKDPTPNTVFNEIQYEFFHRVDKANRKFRKRFKEGWETDRGRIYLLYGPPQKIENNRYATETKPYIVWTYEDIGKKFLFVDENNDSEFTLVTEGAKE